MNKRSKLAALLGAGLLTFAVVGAAFAAAGGGVSVTLCHATPPDTGANGYTSITTDTNSDGSLKGGHDSEHDADIIPPYVDGTFSYPGKNWDAVGQDIYNGGACDGDGIIGGGVTDAPPVVTDQPPTDTALGTTGSSGPADTAWLLVVALGVLLASIVVLTPARAKSRR